MQKNQGDEKVAYIWLIPLKSAFSRPHVLTHLCHVSPRLKSHYVPNPVSPSQASCSGVLSTMLSLSQAFYTGQAEGQEPFQYPQTAHCPHQCFYFFLCVFSYIAHHKAMVLVQLLPSSSAFSRAAHLTHAASQPLLATVKEMSNRLKSAAGSWIGDHNSYQGPHQPQSSSANYWVPYSRIFFTTLTCPRLTPEASWAVLISLEELSPLVTVFKILV